MKVLLCERVNDLLHRDQGLDYREAEELCCCPSWSNSLWQGWSCGLVHCPGGNATDLIWWVLASSDGISSWIPLKPHHSISCWLSVQWEPSACRSCQCCQKKGSSKVCGWICSIWPSWVWESQHASTGNSWFLGHSSRFSFHCWSPDNQELQDLNWSAQPSPCCHDAFHSDLLWTQIFRIFSSTWIIVCTVPTLIVSIDTRLSLSMKFFIWQINSGVLTSLLLPHLSSSLTDSLPSLNLLCLSKTDARFMQDCPKAVWSIPYVSVAFFPSFKQNFIAYRSSKVSSCPDCIFEIYQLWQLGFSSVYSNCFCSCSFEPEIIIIGQSSHKKYSNNIVNFQESMTILNACTKKVWKYIEQNHISSNVTNWNIFSKKLDNFNPLLIYLLPSFLYKHAQYFFRCNNVSYMHKGINLFIWATDIYRSFLRHYTNAPLKHLYGNYCSLKFYYYVKKPTNKSPNNFRLQKILNRMEEKYDMKSNLVECLYIYYWILVG